MTFDLLPRPNHLTPEQTLIHFLPSHGLLSRKSIAKPFGDLHLGSIPCKKSLLKSIRVIFWLVKLASFGGSILLCFFQIGCFSYTLVNSYSFHSPFSYGDLLIRSFWLLMSCRYSYIRRQIFFAFLDDFEFSMIRKMDPQPRSYRKKSGKV